MVGKYSPFTRDTVRFHLCVDTEQCDSKIETDFLFLKIPVLSQRITVIQFVSSCFGSHLKLCILQMAALRPRYGTDHID
jgi:hypothetical protein